MQAISEVGAYVYQIVNGGLRAGRRLLENSSATNDLLTLFNRTVKFIDKAYAPIQGVGDVTRAFQVITDFSSAKSIVERSSKFLSGESIAGTEGHVDWLLVCRESVKMVVDFFSTTRFLQTIQVVATGIFNSTKKVVVFGIEIVEDKGNVLISEAAMVVGNVLNIVNTYRTARTRGWTAIRVLDTGMDVGKTAATLLYRRVAAVAAGILVITSLMAVAKYFINTYWDPAPPGGGALPIPVRQH